MSREGFDEFGNPRGRAFDLGGGDEGRVRGENILFYSSLYPYDTFAEAEMRTLMAERGLGFDVVHGPYSGGCTLTGDMLSRYSQLWYVSGDEETLSAQQVQMIVKYVRAGNGLAIWADNEPFYADANLLAGALIGTRFSGNEPGDRVMVPGPVGTLGRFVEHQLTQGVNNLYEGNTICTIAPATGVTLLGLSHDGQSCLGCYEREGHRVVLDAGFTKLYRGLFEKSAGLGRYLSNIAFWLARGSRGVSYQLLTPGRERIETFTKGEPPKGYRFTVDGPAEVTCILQWDGKATLGLGVRGPDGALAARQSSPRSPVRLSVTARTAGTWVAEVEGVDVQADRVPYVVTLSTEGAGTSGDDRTAQVIPVYFICDVSAAAAGDLADISAVLRHIQRDLAKADTAVKIGVITFAGRARTVMPLASPSMATTPTLAPGGDGRSYGAALREFERTFARDRAELVAAGAKIFRPCVFFLTHGEPDDADFATAMRSTLGYDPATRQGNRAYPLIIPIGLRRVAESTLARLAYPDFGEAEKRGRWFLAEPEAATRQTLKGVADAIRTALRDAHALGVGGARTFVPPASIPGTRVGTAQGAPARR
ncbi:hypothetical protein [Luedemannella helvata]|uniref:VWFA domain-containing protein n=1 Tax=Luedemannella helvata TaxID=349315 RepID=A0ABP4VWV4_9ACTN